VGKAITLEELAKALDAELVGDAAYSVDGIASLDSATPSALSFVSQDSYLKFLSSTEAGVVILKPEWSEEYSGNKLLVPDPYLAYAKASAFFESLSNIGAGVHSSAIVAESASLAAGVCVAANCVIGENVEIGENVRLFPGVVIGDGSSIGDGSIIHPNVSIYHNIKIGQRCIVHSGVVIGSDGFGFAPSGGKWNKIHQLGGVRIGDDVEIGSNTSIDRGAVGHTVIENGVIIDNLVHIAHNVHIGSGSAIAGCVGIAGSTVIGKNCTVAGAVAINGHIKIADNTHFHGGTIVTKGNTEAGFFASAPPMQDVKKWRRNSVRYTQLDELSSKVKSLEKQLKTIIESSD